MDILETVQAMQQLAGLGRAVRDYISGDMNVKNKYGQNINDWCVGAIQGMNYIFFGLGSFNGNIGRWDVSLVTTMRSMVRTFGMVEIVQLHRILSHSVGLFFQFRGATSFNQNIGGWNVSVVTNMLQMVRTFWDSLLDGSLTQFWFGLSV